MAITPQRGNGIVLVRARGLEVVADPTYLVSLAVLTAFVGLPVATRVVPGGGPPALLFGLLIAALCSVSIVAHELAHTVVARVLGHRVRRITLFSLGGVSHVEGRARVPAPEYLVALAGPLTSLLIAAPMVLIGRSLSGSRWDAPFLAIGLVNFFLGAFNLVPAFPMDGGRILRSGLWAVLRDRARATRAAVFVGRTFAGALIAVGVLSIISGLSSDDGALFNGAWQVLLGTFLYGAAGQEMRADEASDREAVRSADGGASL